MIHAHKWAALATLGMLAACQEQVGVDAEANKAAANLAIPDISTNAEAGLVNSTDVARTALPAMEFANAVAASDAFEIATSRLAAEKAGAGAGADKVKAFAAMMIKDHGASTMTLKAAAASATPPITPNGALSAQQQSDLDRLAMLSGADFDREYARLQVSAHEKALALLEPYASRGDLPAFKSFAGTLVPKVTAHLEQARGLVTP